MRAGIIVLVACFVSTTATASQLGQREGDAAPAGELLAAAAKRPTGKQATRPAGTQARRAPKKAVKPAPLAPLLTPAATDATAAKAPAAVESAATASTSTGHRVALVGPASAAKVTPAARATAARLTESELTGQGLVVLGSRKLASFYKTGRVPNCGDSPACLARIGKTASVPFVATLSVRPVGKNFAVKLTVVDSDKAALVSNIVSFVAKPNEAQLGTTIAKQAVRAAAAINQHVEESRPEPQLVARVEESTGPELAPLVPAATAPALAPLVPEASAPLASLEAGAESEAEVDARLEAELLAAMETEVAGGTSVGAPVPAAALPTAEAAVSGGGSKVVSYALLGAGAAAIGVGFGLFGVEANAAAADFKAGRNPAESRDRARSQALLSDVTVGGGLALVGAGIVTWLLADSGSGPAVTVAPAGKGVAVAGRF